MRPTCGTSGFATAEAMVWGSPPGNPAPTPMTGKFTLGSEAPVRKLNARIPESSSAAANSDVPIGRRINGVEMLIFSAYRLTHRRGLRRNLVSNPVSRKLLSDPVEPQIDDRS